MQIVLIRNYYPDKQESMKRFADMLEYGLQRKGVHVVNVYPTVWFGKFTKSTISGLGKWLGYVDKWILFPLVLQFSVRSKFEKTANNFFHICDHSNSPYLSYLPKKTTGITCHDVLAIRGALGYEDAYCPASSFGKILQMWILKNLAKAHLLACVSHFTYRQLIQLTPTKADAGSKWTVIHNAFNADFSRLAEDDYSFLLDQTVINRNMPFLLHVGSGLPRKNRKMLVDMLDMLNNRWKGTVCFAGEAIDQELQDYIEEKQLNSRVVSVVNPDHHLLNALYNACYAFVFPSFSEGFGWPVIEAQACGAAVIASQIEPMPEVAGNAALFADPRNPESFADALLALQDENVRQALISNGYANVKRFSLPVIIEKYIDLYKPNTVASNVC